MEIVNVIQCANLGGMEQASLRLMTSMKKRGHSFHVISLNPIAGLGPLLAAAEIPAMGLDYSKLGKVRTFLKLRRIVANLKADALILTGHNFAASLALSGVGPKRRIYAFHFHHEGVMAPWRWRLIYRVAVRDFRSATFPSDYVRKEAEAIFPPIRRIADTVRNPLDRQPVPTRSQGNQLRARFAIPDESPIVGNAGWLIERKRFDVFLRAAAIIHETMPDVHFFIAGDGDQLVHLEALASKLGIARSTHFLGWLPDLDPFYAAIDVLLFNSDWDALGNTPLEAMARGIPVVASVTHGGLDEVLDDRFGWLLSYHDIEMLAGCVLEAFGAEGRRRGMAGRERVCEMSDSDAIAEFVERKLS